MKKDDVPLTNEEFNKKFRKRETQRLLEARPIPFHSGLDRFIEKEAPTIKFPRPLERSAKK